MKKILCPIDFSNAALSGVEYAAYLAKQINATLTLFHVQPTIWPEATHLRHEVQESMENITRQLDIASVKTSAEFGIPCDYGLVHTTDTIEMAIAAKSELYDLIVMGTNGADNYYQFLFGSNTYHVLKTGHCPILVVPEGYAFKRPGRIIYAYDPRGNPHFDTRQLILIADYLKVEIRILHISRSTAVDERVEKRDEIKHIAQEYGDIKINWEVDVLDADEVSFGLDQYMKDTKGDILALLFPHRHTIDLLSGKNVVRKISMAPNYPVFIFWE